MNASGAANAASHAEEYALWGERIRLLFSSPPSYVETSLHQNPFERHSCCVPSHLSDVAPAAESPARSEATLRAPFQSAADTDPVASAGACGAYPDEELFPACFYARLLQSRGSTASMPSDALPGSASITTLLQTQKLRVDEEDMAKRLAERLRERAALVRKRLHRLRTVPPSNLVSPFLRPQGGEAAGATSLGADCVFAGGAPGEPRFCAAAPSAAAQSHLAPSTRWRGRVGRLVTPRSVMVPSCT
ncbi:hypothetical protein GH5_01246 [Leishmania sp. Ghana 2012 LV757]|uniref:hypothetical protein n=1 Tax=Leishmania sp. Ghana 2012 LV757 TaxID=2803181 RepID=UPI001B5CCDB2|nr:hypothetical protein GH5_01246 [Leishmania sp. Ghana 2012 LV757]